MSNGISQALNSEQDLASIPMAQGGLSRLAIARLKSAGVPVEALLRRAGLTPEVIADPEERLNVRSQVALLDEAAIALKDDRLGALAFHGTQTDTKLSFACLLHYEFAACSQGRISYRNTSRLLIIGRKAPPKWRVLSERKWSLALTQTSLP
jgi:hypothetical protein